MAVRVGGFWKAAGASRRGVVQHITICRGHQGRHPTWCMSAPTAHASAPDRVHRGGRPRHVHVTLRSNTSREARNQAMGRLPMRNGSRHEEAQHCESANACISKICHTAPAYERPPLAETFCGKV